MSSDEADNKNAEENTQDTLSSADESEKKNDAKEEKVNNKSAAAKKKGADAPKIKQPAKKRVKSEQAEKEVKKDDKKEDKKKKESEAEEDEESAEENDVENHKAVPLLDQPLEISGSRKRKEVQRFIPPPPEDDNNKEVKIPEGKGKALGDIERIDNSIQKSKPEDLKILHRLCFNKPGKATTIKKNLKKFNGFDFEEASDDYEKKKTNIEKSFKKVTVGQLKNLCHILDIEKSGNKDDILDRILSFLTCPVDSGKKVSSGLRAKRKGVSSKNYDEGFDSAEDKKVDKKKSGEKKKGKGKKKDKESGESENEKEESEEDEGEEKDTKQNDKKVVETTEESEPEEEEETSKKGAKKGKKANQVAEKKAPPKKRALAKKALEKKSDSEADADGDDESEDEEPLLKKAKTPPTDEEIKTYVKSLLEGANLELITMKKVCQDVYAHYPEFDLGHKKDFIKTTVKSLISS